MCRTESQRLFHQYGYHGLMSRPGGNEPDWAYAWTGVKEKLARKLAQRYGHLVSRYFHGVLPKFMLVGWFINKGIN